MIKALKSLFEFQPADSENQQRDRVQLAAAALLIETARADFSQSEEESKALANLLCSELQLEAAQVEEIIALADKELDKATSLYEFTRIINDQYEPAQKLHLISAMWKVAYADGNLDKYEESLIRQVATLIYVSHSDYIRLKLASEDG